MTRFVVLNYLTSFKHIPSNYVAVASFLAFGIIISLTWYVPGHFFAIGDNYPKVHATETFIKSFYLWSDEHFGYFNTASPIVTHWLIWAILDSNFGIGLGEIVFYGIMMGGSMYFIYLLSFRMFKNVPGAVVSSLLYVFNFFYVNQGYTLTIAYGVFFLPLIIVVYLRIVDKIRLKADHLRETLLFVIILAVSIPILYVNPGVLYVVFLASLIFPIAYLINGKERKRIIRNFIVIAVLVVPVISWFILANYVYLNTSNSSLDFVKSDWSWTHKRLTTFNLLKLDGAWSWSEYWSKQYVDLYNNPILVLTSYLPIVLCVAAVPFAIFYKRDRVKPVFLCIFPVALILIFLKDSTGPFGHFVYDMLPFSFVFREPYTKFLIPLTMFISLLAGFSIPIIYHQFVSRISLNSFKNNRFTTIIVEKKIILKAIGVLIVLSLLSNGLLLLGNFHLQSLIIPGNEDKFSTYVTTPIYWTEAAEWINQQKGDWKILFLPNDDFYQMPYEWGYYGVDYLSLYINKPVIMEYYEYLLPSNTIKSIGSIYDAIRLNDSVYFQKELRSHNVKYIIQRNDVISDLPGRNILDPQTIKTFLSSQKDFRKVKEFGKLDIYEFADVSNGPLYDNNRASNSTIYQFDEKYDGWRVNLPTFIKTVIDSKNSFLNERSLRIELVKRPHVWATINSPLSDANMFSVYTWQLAIRGENAYEVHAKVVGYDKGGKVVDTKYLKHIGNGTFDWKKISASYVIHNPTITKIQLQIWFGFETTTPIPNKIWLDNVNLFETHYDRLNPSAYHITLPPDSGPVTLQIDQTYDPLWQARIDNKVVRSEPGDWMLNGFSISQNKSSDVIIEYGPQTLFIILVAFSFSLLAVYLLLLICPSLLMHKRILAFRERIPYL